MIKSFGRLWIVRPFDGRHHSPANDGMVAKANRGVSALVLSLWLLVAACPAAAPAKEVKEGFVTVTFGNSPNAQHHQTLKIEQDMMHLDLWLLPKRIQTR